MSLIIPDTIKIKKKHSTCTIENCTKNARDYHGMCISHGLQHGVGKCIMENCTFGARSTLDPYCISHGSIKYKKKLCNVEGCESQARARINTCLLHAGDKINCIYPNCTKKEINKHHYCRSHYQEYIQMQKYGLSIHLPISSTLLTA
jgi:hypothetical protein